MNPVLDIRDSHAIVYDAECVQDPGPELFEPDWWRRAQRLTGAAPGRGSALFVDAPFGSAVLRRYQRGGWPARLTRDRYLFTGVRRARPMLEFDLLRRLHAHGLPVPAPVAGLCSRTGLFYRGALLTHAILGVVPLADLLGRVAAEDPVWAATGRCLARFHRAGVGHADLNARNILVQTATGKVFLVDFDRGVYRPGQPRNARAGLARLRRSLVKLWPADRIRLLEPSWLTLLEASHA
ncbi:MAG: 3-deoxy-D-manno-octulosonic acid kinase [Xanthomonadales bacterium]|nr:3-deoxy-D-manno-octulosonic acid kinase [Xanthomonadales bacterium]NIN60713.1 3-deoxy-D-manno-octulosonic acid kinase [Xanthomonadales bacterium]NIN76075.1 3-deoxy-D-manno-octulosonic acid kinase [Xanthomonadales bacterium]NIO13686.1 3-deoxy-D-manno-octulosonic acid kinase [Xanthomonadales bacterium]NIP13106.1 3-deoxy-D-manno-octulosonic acid kinase [Xanthomonadales bacterium]